MPPLNGITTTTGTAFFLRNEIVHNHIFAPPAMVHDMLVSPAPWIRYSTG